MRIVTEALRAVFGCCRALGHLESLLWEDRGTAHLAWLGYQIQALQMQPDQSHQSPARTLTGGGSARTLLVLQILQRVKVRMLVCRCSAQTNWIQAQQRLCPG